jgi:hypothetical protein
MDSAQHKLQGLRSLVEDLYQPTRLGELLLDALRELGLPPVELSAYSEHVNQALQAVGLAPMSAESAPVRTEVRLTGLAAIRL